MPPIPPDQIDDVLTAAAALVVALAVLAGVLLGRQVKADGILHGIANQVSNDHGTNLRDDIDAISAHLTDIKALMAEDRAALAEVRTNAHDTHKQIFERLAEIEKNERNHNA